MRMGRDIARRQADRANADAGLPKAWLQPFERELNFRRAASSLLQIDAEPQCRLVRIIA